MQRRAAWKKAVEDGTNWTAAEAGAALDAQEKSGASVAAFGRREGIGVRRLYWWRGRLATKRREAAGRFIPLTLAHAAPIERPRSNGRVVIIEGGVRVEIEEPESVSPLWVATLVGRLREEGK